MSKLLVVDACSRGRELSRTWRLCEALLRNFRARHPQAAIEVVRLDEEALSPMTAPLLAQREELLASGALEDEMFRHGRQFVAADRVVVAAPYWDLSFPAVLKLYLERVCAVGVTFHYTERGQEGLCRAESLTYVTTAGGPIGDRDFGSDYLRGLCGLWGIGRFASLAAEGLDIVGADVEGILGRAEARAAEIAKRM